MMCIAARIKYIGSVGKSEKNMFPREEKRKRPSGDRDNRRSRWTAIATLAL
jgi:hypothetical protein